MLRLGQSLRTVRKRLTGTRLFTASCILIDHNVLVLGKKCINNIICAVNVCHVDALGVPELAPKYTVTGVKAWTIVKDGQEKIDWNKTVVTGRAERFLTKLSSLSLFVLCKEMIAGTTADRHSYC